jgi:hypothetical protein
MEPEVQYPLMATLCDKKEFDKLDRVIIRAKCSALGLNENFPRVILYGPLEYGGMALPTTISKTVTTRITYFLYHIRTSSKIGSKLDASIVYLQLEVGLFKSFFQSSYDIYGYLATKTLTKQIWAETEPNGLQLRHHQNQTWLPTSQGIGDVPIMEIVCCNYNKREALRINRYRLYLQVISLHDLLTYDGLQIHPDIARGKRVSSRTSTIHWVDFPKPPKKDAALWISFMQTHISPFTTVNPIKWDRTAPPTYRTTFMTSLVTDKLYSYSNDRIVQFEPKNTRRRTQYRTFHKNYIEVELTPDVLASLAPVQVHQRSNDIQILCDSNINIHNIQMAHNTSNHDLTSLYSRLPMTLQCLCGSVQIPEGGGTKLIQYLLNNNKPLLGASDASLKDGNSSHAWILTTGELDHLSDPSMQLSGGGPVDGFKADQSSARGEIHGQTALALMAQTLLQAHGRQNMPTIFYGDNIGVQRKCRKMSPFKLRDHRQPNHDLYLEYHNAVQTLNNKAEWVKGHQDEGKPWNDTRNVTNG